MKEITIKLTEDEAELVVIAIEQIQEAYCNAKDNQKLYMSRVKRLEIVKLKLIEK